MKVIKDESLWVEKFRPQTVEDCILPDRIKRQFLSMIDKNNITNMLLTGSAGVGKTTIARALCNDIGAEYTVVNCSDNRGLDLLRTTITEFASSASLYNKPKVMILDESDHLTANTMAALRNGFETYSKSCKFILTGNYESKFTEALKSRCTHIKFEITKDELAKMQISFVKRVFDILEYENVTFDKGVVAKVVAKFYPDCRKTLGELQTYSASGAVDEGILTAIKSIDIEDLIKYLKESNFKEVRQWASNNADNDTHSLYKKLYKALGITSVVKPSSIPLVIQILNDYQRYDGVVPDKELHLVSMMVSLLAEIEWA